jgi:hypothetical protein
MSQTFFRYFDSAVSYTIDGTAVPSPIWLPKIIDWYVYP